MCNIVLSILLAVQFKLCDEIRARVQYSCETKHQVCSPRKFFH